MCVQKGNPEATFFSIEACLDLLLISWARYHSYHRADLAAKGGGVGKVVLDWSIAGYAGLHSMR